MGLFGRWGKAGGGDPTQPEPAEAASGGEYADLDGRVSKLLTDFEHRRFGIGPTGAVDYALCRDTVLDLHDEVTDEKSRVALVRFHGALMSTGVDGLIREGRDPSELEALWRQDYFTMLTKEVVASDGGVDEAALEHVNRREREAGRLADGESFQVRRQAAVELRQANGAPTARFVGERAITLWTVVLRSIAPTQRDILLQSFAEEGSRDWLTEAELGFLLNEEPDHKEIVAFGWQAERLAVLLWSLGLTEIPAHDAKCDPISFAPLMPPTSQVEFETFLGGLQLRDPLEIDAAVADINEAYWTAHAAEAEGRPAPEGVDLEILGERLRAAAWLVGQKVPEWP